MENQIMDSGERPFKTIGIITFFAIANIVFFILFFNMLSAILPGPGILPLFLSIIALLSSIGVLFLKNKIAYRILSVLVVISFISYSFPIWKVVLYLINPF
jgi:hypothetical protein